MYKPAITLLKPHPHRIYIGIVLPVLYGCEAWSLRRIFVPRRDEVTGEWRLHNEELNDLYCSPNIENEMGWACGAYG
jgi:hypothetical protein